MKLLILLITLLFQTFAMAVEVSADRNNLLNRSSSPEERSQVQAAVPHNSFYCQGCIEMERVRRQRRLGGFGDSAESRGAFVPGSTPAPVQNPNNTTGSDVDVTN